LARHVNDLTPLRLADAPSEAAVTVETTGGLAAFKHLQPEWDDFFRRCATPHQVFQNPSFLRAWASGYAGDGSGLMMIVARAGGQLVGIAPLVRRRRLGLEVLQFMGAPVGQFDDMLLDGNFAELVLAQVGAALARSGADLLEARRIREDGALWNLRHRQVQVFERMDAPFAELTLRVQNGQPGPAYSAKDRSNYRRRMRRLGERGALAFRSVLPGAEAVRLAEQAIAMKAASLRRDGMDWGTVGCTRFQDFFRRLAGDASSGLLVSVIELDGAPIGIDLSFLCKGVGFGHVLATDGAFDREGLGQILVHHVLAEAGRAGASHFDLLAPADAYKRHHADGATRVESRAYAFTTKGRLAARLGYGLVMPAARKLPRPVIRLLRGE